jgi:glucose-1-phosphate cytidylyltransferase
VKVVILAGGWGTRLAEETEVKPKPMVEIGGRPILDHIMRWYAHFNYREFIVALGYKGDVIKQYFLNNYSLNSDLSISLKTGEARFHNQRVDDWVVHLVDTGLQTMTGGRLRRLRHWLDEDLFMMTYGDGVSDINIHALVDFHCSHGQLATVTAVRPPARFGALIFDGDQVLRFSEKPQTGEGWINGGYFVLNRQVLDYIDGDATMWETSPLERLAAEGELMAYKHEGFWQPMDTLREKLQLEQLWQSGKAPWRAE